MTLSLSRTSYAASTLRSLSSNGQITDEHPCYDVSIAFSGKLGQGGRQLSQPRERSVRQTMRQFFRSFFQIGTIAYDAAPGVLLLTVKLHILQALLPVISVCLFKLMFDRLGVFLTTEAVFSFQINLLLLVLLLGLVIMVTQGLIALDTIGIVLVFSMDGMWGTGIIQGRAKVIPPRTGTPQRSQRNHLILDWLPCRL